ncbi:glycosyltransferase family 4 protein [Patulibacter minatonensis]|uniref:glycosyltransferase family 4 protein n=1 Tax=Patulibacter minatonensis TaxID=298163 RepID=UPI00047E6CC5|nr:glycosyltransferase family 4 protein [Patulibacter minatonensis]
MILHLHHRYRTLGGEEPAIAALRRLTEDVLGEETALLERDSTAISGARAAAGLLRGGLDPDEVVREVRRTGARIVHAHNVHPTFGARALRAARAGGARVVLQLHNYRLVCAVGTCVRDGEDCSLCHAGDTRPGLRHRCRGGRAEGAVYAAGLALQRRPLVAGAEAIAVPSVAALRRLHDLGAGLPEDRTHVVPHPVQAGPPVDPDPSGPAVVAGRLAPEKGTATAIAAARITGRPLVVANTGPLEDELRAAAADLPHVTFAGRLDRAGLDALRARAAVELVPSLAHETFGLAAAEAMLRGLPVVASDVGALRELVPDDARVPPGDAQALAAAWDRLAGDAAAGARQRDHARGTTDPAIVADRLRALYAAATGA